MTTPPQNYYKVIIKNNYHEVMGNMTEDLTTNIASSYKSLWELATSASSKAGAIGDMARQLADTMSAFGVTVKAGSAADQLVWQSTEPLEMIFNLRFVAESSEERDVLAPLRSLVALTTPASVNTNTQGVRVINSGNASLDASYKISLTVGNYLYLENVVITNTQVQWENRIGRSGYPIAAQAQVSIKTGYILYQQEILAAFKGAAVPHQIGAVKGSNPNTPASTSASSSDPKVWDKANTTTSVA